ncbi:cell division protein ZipA [Marinomonas atlantica]|uniref:cell division protein ZipA n=1 Tax=Marinomonas atlantica TaxID=1806668 RepID=UPI000831D843|nr:cell division protein ZipA [Marinomonas atlantica]MCO4786896.1 cell division protein ZipA [Marinomonas atlantica]
MDFSLREWLIVIGVIIIIGILVDGYRRYRKSQAVSTFDDSHYDDPEERKKEALLRRELPNGGARPVGHQEEHTDPVMNAFENARKTARSPLTDLPHKVDAGPELDRNDQFELDELASLVPNRFDEQPNQEINREHDYGNVLYDGYDDLRGSVPYTETGVDLEDNHEPYSELDDDVEVDLERDYSSVNLDQSSHLSPMSESVEDDDEEAEIEEVIVINVFSPEDEPFAGMELLQLVLNCGMRYGDMDIFHRHEEGFDKGKIQFSMANAIEPGTFDLDTMGETDCPGVSFFMGLPGPKNSMKAYDFMLETAQTLVRNLGGELRDERREPMSDQTIAHCRQRIKDFERRQLTKKIRNS